jgi:hypothetical protein
VTAIPGECKTIPWIAGLARGPPRSAAASRSVNSAPRSARPAAQHVAIGGRTHDPAKGGARDLRRFSPAKRYALVTCFLVEAQRTTLDHLVEMHRQFLTGVARRSRRAVELRQKEVRQRAKRGLAIVLQAMDIILDEERPAETRLADLYRELDEKTLRDAVETCRNLNELTEYGYLDELVARHTHLERYLPRFLTLPFRAERGGAGPCRPESPSGRSRASPSPSQTCC